MSLYTTRGKGGGGGISGIITTLKSALPWMNPGLSDTDSIRNIHGHLFRVIRRVAAGSTLVVDWTRWVDGDDVTAFFAGGLQLRYRGTHLRGGEVPNPHQGDVICVPSTGNFEIFHVQGVGIPLGWYGAEHPEGWLGLFNTEADADHAVTANNQIVIYGGQVHISSNYVAPAEDHVSYLVQELTGAGASTGAVDLSDLRDFAKTGVDVLVPANRIDADIARDSELPARVSDPDEEFGSTPATWTNTDLSDFITAHVTGRTLEQIQDVVGGMFTANSETFSGGGQGSFTYQDVGGKIVVVVRGLFPGGGDKDAFLRKSSASDWDVEWGEGSVFGRDGVGGYAAALVGTATIDGTGPVAIDTGIAIPETSVATFLLVNFGDDSDAADASRDGVWRQIAVANLRDDSICPEVAAGTALTSFNSIPIEDVYDGGAVAFLGRIAGGNVAFAASEQNLDARPLTVYRIGTSSTARTAVLTGGANPAALATVTPTSTVRWQLTGFTLSDTEKAASALEFKIWCSGVVFNLQFPPEYLTELSDGAAGNTLSGQSDDDPPRALTRAGSDGISNSDVRVWLGLDANDNVLYAARPQPDSDLEAKIWMWRHT